VRAIHRKATDGGLCMQKLRLVTLELVFGAPDDLAEYLVWVAANARKVDVVELAITADPEEKLTERGGARGDLRHRDAAQQAHVRRDSGS
jgi:hypothetical protein